MSQPQAYPGPLGPFWLFFSPIGRVSREPYMLALGFLWAVFAIPVSLWVQTLEIPGDQTAVVTMEDFVNSHPLLPYMLFASHWVVLALAIKRLQDRGLTGFLAVLIFVPVINFFFVIGLGLMPGEPGPNAYGPRPNSRWAKPS